VGRVVGRERLGRRGTLVDNGHHRRRRHRLSGDRLGLDGGITRTRTRGVIRRCDVLGRIVLGSLRAVICSGLPCRAVLRCGFRLSRSLLIGLPGDLVAVVGVIIEVDGRGVIRAGGLGGSSIRSRPALSPHLGLLSVGGLRRFGRLSGPDGLDGVGCGV